MKGKRKLDHACPFFRLKIEDFSSFFAVVETLISRPLKKMTALIFMSLRLTSLPLVIARENL